MQLPIKQLPKTELDEKLLSIPQPPRRNPKATNVLSSVSGLIETDGKESYQTEMLSHHMLVTLKGLQVEKCIESIQI